MDPSKDSFDTLQSTLHPNYYGGSESNKLGKDYGQKIMDGSIAVDPALLDSGLGHMVNDGAHSRGGI